MEYKHRTTGEVITVGRLRTYINDDGTKREVDIATGKDLDDYERIVETDKDFKNIKAKANPRDSSSGLR